ncbi:MAG: hypothetical protein ACYC1L_19215 [Alphaproteobacteria bacterium]
MVRRVALFAIAFLVAVAADLGATNALYLIDADDSSANRAGDTAFILVWALALVLIVRHMRKRRAPPEPAAE